MIISNLQDHSREAPGLPNGKWLLLKHAAFFDSTADGQQDAAAKTKNLLASGRRRNLL